jgi:hypothetical protein
MASSYQQKHTCKQASSEQLFNRDETNDRIYHVRQNMLISLDAATRTWTEDKTSVHALKLSTQADGQISEILSIKHHSSTDKSVKIPLKSVNVIDLLIGRENHWTSSSGPARPRLPYFESKCYTEADSSLPSWVHFLFIWPSTMI